MGIILPRVFLGSSATQWVHSNAVQLERKNSGLIISATKRDFAMPSLSLMTMFSPASMSQMSRKTLIVFESGLSSSGSASNCAANPSTHFLSALLWLRKMSQSISPWVGFVIGLWLVIQRPKRQEVHSGLWCLPAFRFAARRSKAGLLLRRGILPPKVASLDQRLRRSDRYPAVRRRTHLHQRNIAHLRKLGRRWPMNLGPRGPM